MPAKDIIAGAFSGVFVGQYGSSSKLTRIKSIRTGGIRISSGFETVPLAVKDFSDEQAGTSKLRVPVTFYGDAKQIKALAMGTWNPTYGDAPSTLSEYIFLFIHPRGGNHHLYIPRAKTVKSFELSWDKDRPTILPVVLTFEYPDRFTVSKTATVQPFYQRVLTGDPPNDLQSLLGSTYPF